jgi:hypothetical protein
VLDTPTFLPLLLLLLLLALSLLLLFLPLLLLPLPLLLLPLLLLLYPSFVQSHLVCQPHPFSICFCCGPLVINSLAEPMCIRHLHTYAPTGIHVRGDHLWKHDATSLWHLRRQGPLQGLQNATIDSG